MSPAVTVEVDRVGVHRDDATVQDRLKRGLVGAVLGATAARQSVRTVEARQAATRSADELGIVLSQAGRLKRQDLIDSLVRQGAPADVAVKTPDQYMSAARSSPFVPDICP